MNCVYCDSNNTINSQYCMWCHNKMIHDNIEYQRNVVKKVFEMFPYVEPEYMITEHHITNLLIHVNYAMNKGCALYYIIKSINARKKKIWTKWQNRCDCEKILNSIYETVPLNLDNAKQVISYLLL